MGRWCRGGVGEMVVVVVVVGGGGRELLKFKIFVVAAPWSFGPSSQHWPETDGV